MNDAEETDNILDIVYEGLVEDLEVTRLPEAVFKGHFLPYFSGEQELEKDSPVILQWAEMAGSITSSVDIVRPDGSIVIRIPPILNTEAINVTGEKDEKPFNDVMIEYQLHKDGLPGAADAYLENEMRGKYDISPEEQQAKEDKWIEIIRPYKGNPAGIDNKNTVEVGAISDDDIDYD